MNPLKGKPFYLDDEDIKWIENTKNAMTIDEKVGQLFCLVTYSDDEQELKQLIDKAKPGGLMLRTLPAQSALKIHSFVQRHSKIPLLLSANLEKGGNGIAVEGSNIASQMQIGATGNQGDASLLGEVCGKEAQSVMSNWAYAPVVDIDFNFRNPITNTRTFGSDVGKVSELSVRYIKAIQKQGVAACAKHFPGDGVDERDQHLVTSINSMGVEQWQETYGKVYKDCIEAGVKSIMAGHIIQPNLVKKMKPTIKDEEILPASLCYELLTTLLKDEMGFNGLLISDASAMNGMLIAMDRKDAVPCAIAAGCDMFMFTRNMEEDYKYMKDGIKNGIISEQRLDEALTKILALKASLGLRELCYKQTVDFSVLGCDKHIQYARDIADRSITLVKNTKVDILPLNTSKYKRILLHMLEPSGGFLGEQYTSKKRTIVSLLEKEGFQVTIFDAAKGFEGMLVPYKDTKENVDLILYVAALATKSNQTTVRIDWSEPMGANVPAFTSVIPTIFISLENPYHLLDVPRVPVYINTYNSSGVILEQLIEKLMGRSAFKGVSPVDCFCGKWDTHL